MEVHPERDRVRIAPAGELDLATVTPLDEKLRELEEAGFDRLVLDLRGLTFIDCTGLRVLVEAQARALAAGRALDVICGPGQVRRVLALTGVDEQLHVVPRLGALTIPAAIEPRP